MEKGEVLSMYLTKRIKTVLAAILTGCLLLATPGALVSAQSFAVKAGMINGIRIDMIKVGGWTQIAKFPSSAIDMSSIKYLAIEVGNSTGAGWGFEVHLLDESGKRTMLFSGAPEQAGADDVIQLYDDAYVLHTTNKAYYASAFTLPNFGGWMLIPRAALHELSSLDLSKIAGLTLNFNCTDGNKGMQVEIGRVGWFSENPDAKFSNLKLLFDPAKMTDAQLDTDLLLDNGGGLASFSRVKKNPKAALKTCKTIGDVRILEDMTEGYPASESEMNKALAKMVYAKGGGVTPTVYKDEDTDGNALRYDITGPVEGNEDYYSAVTFVAKAGLSDWRTWNTQNGKKAQGVTFWVKNLSDYEVSLGLEIDEYDPGAKAGDNGERWSLQYGTRVLLYDVNTKQQYIVQSQPHLFIPVGFTGWVRVPFSFYTKAPWCTWGNDVQDFLDVPQIAVISDSNINQGLSFAIDNLGVYYEETLVSTGFFDSGMSLPERMGIK